VSTNEEGTKDGMTGWKAQPVRIVAGEGYVPCSVEDAKHLTVRFPGPVGLLTLPVILHGSRDGHPRGCVWTWNGSTKAPTLRPSVRTRREHGDPAREGFVCHSWVNDGRAEFLSDSTHELAGQTVDMLDVEEEPDAEPAPGDGTECAHCGLGRAWHARNCPVSIARATV
jgi:hypothetical protein